MCVCGDSNRFLLVSKEVVPFFLHRNATNRLEKLVKDLDKEVSMDGLVDVIPVSYLTCYHRSDCVLFICEFLSGQMSSRQKVEASLRQLEREQALLQHQSADNLRKVEIETDRKRSLENECKQLVSAFTHSPHFITVSISGCGASFLIVPLDQHVTCDFTCLH